MNQLPLPSSLLADLRRVDRAVMARLQSQAAVFAVAGPSMLRSEEKRLRAALVLLTAQLGTYEFERVLHAATAVEIIHAAVLVHDDLVDMAARRRDTTTGRGRWNHGVALMVGDYLFAVAASEMAQSPDTRIITYFSHAVMSISEGELSPVMQATPLETALEQYYATNGATTAALFAAACKAGMASGGGSDAQIEALAGFGYNLGLAYQMTDDILDVTADEALRGRPAGSTLRRGVITLPLIYAVNAGGDAQLASIVDTGDESRIAWAVAEVQRLGIDRARAAARQAIDRALRHLDPFPDSPARRNLREMAEFVLERAP